MCAIMIHRFLSVRPKPECNSLLEGDGASHTPLIFILNQMPSGLLSYLICLDRYLRADIGQSIEGVPSLLFK